MKPGNPDAATAKRIAAIFRKHNVRLTLGGEPTYVPVDPSGSEWNITALGPTKLRYAYAMADALIAQAAPNAVAIYSPGKAYPGETNPRWAINLVWNRDGSPFTKSFSHLSDQGEKLTKARLERFKRNLLTGLKLPRGWLRCIDALAPERAAWALPLDHDGKRFQSGDWGVGKRLELLGAEGPAGLRLPLSLVPAAISRRALVAEVVDDRLHLFLPPLLQPAFLKLLEVVSRSLVQSELGGAVFEGYVPSDDADRWVKLGLTADPGVLEINLPPCADWSAYDEWLSSLEQAAETAGLRSFKQFSVEESSGTGGGNHILFGGPRLDDNPLFTNPGWITSILRYWQHHPALSYLFTGNYVGSSSQAPRPDESASSLYDLELAYQFLEHLPPGDHRGLISETIRHLHTDGSGNTHRSEISFDKFWNVNFDGGCRGLVEFRAVESLPEARWMSAVALLWHSIAAYLLEHPFRKPLLEHGDRLHDHFFLPTNLWADLETILSDLGKAGIPLRTENYRELVDWRFPVMLEYASGEARLAVRKAHEGWPLLCETPLEGGNTSRFVDTSIERLEFLANRTFVDRCQIRVQGRLLRLEPRGPDPLCIGLRYRRTALYPSLHPGIAPHMPLHLTITDGARESGYQLDFGRRTFEPVPKRFPRQRHACKKLQPDLVTCDLRLM